MATLVAWEQCYDEFIESLEEQSRIKRPRLTTGNRQGMCRPLPYADFRWVDHVHNFDLMTIALDSSTGYILEVEYPQHLHDEHAEAMIANPNFHSRSVFSENLVAIELRKTDTNSLIYHVECNDVYDIMKRDINRLDTSDYTVDNERESRSHSCLGSYGSQNKDWYGLESKEESLIGGATGVTKVVNDSKATQHHLEELQCHNRVMEGRDVYLAPYKFGKGIARRKKNVYKTLKMLRGVTTDMQLQQLENRGIASCTLTVSTIYGRRRNSNSIRQTFCEDYKCVDVNARHEFILIRVSNDNNCLVGNPVTEPEVELFKVQWWMPHVALNEIARFRKAYYGINYFETLLNVLSFVEKGPFAVIDCSRQNVSVMSTTVDVCIEFDCKKNVPVNTTAYYFIIHDRVIEYCPLSNVVRKIM
ncbi:hypothetical protein ALC57_18526 [Trachymyrmex cornetzi]|uniref:Double jelly roll-like domain-containing protein n=1 Tax=Trachymyrmex cornetzi TaxID=471704 RepID=A0A151IRL1_9HYME|nr:hypothetical protein ALC57_18526 [Trachymyrmex cornetzi]